MHLKIIYDDTALDSRLSECKIMKNFLQQKNFNLIHIHPMKCFIICIIWLFLLPYHRTIVHGRHILAVKLAVRDCKIIILIIIIFMISYVDREVYTCE